MRILQLLLQICNFSKKIFKLWTCKIVRIIQINFIKTVFIEIQILRHFFNHLVNFSIQILDLLIKIYLLHFLVFIDLIGITILFAIIYRIQFFCYSYQSCFQTINPRFLFFQFNLLLSILYFKLIFRRLIF